MVALGNFFASFVIKKYVCLLNARYKKGAEVWLS